MMKDYCREDEKLFELPSLERQRRLREVRTRLAVVEDTLSYLSMQQATFRKKRDNLAMEIQVLEDRERCSG